MRAIIILDDDAATLADILAMLTTSRRTLVVQQISSSCDSLRDQPVLRESLRAKGLTPRECELVFLDLQGWSRAEIADHLCVTPATITKYWTAIYEKLGIQRRSSLRQWMSAAGCPATIEPILERAYGEDSASVQNPPIFTGNPPDHRD